MWHGGTANRMDRCRRALERQVLALDDANNDRLSTETTRMSRFLA